MKRSYDKGDGKGSDGGPPAKRHQGKGLSPEMRLEVPDAKVLASAVIGKGGQVITEMRRSTGARLALTDHSDFFPQTDCRVLTAQAPTEEALLELCRQLIRITSECAQAAPSDALGQPGELKFRTVAPKAAVGALIGKGGQSIKELREASGAKISVGDPINPQAGFAAEQVVTFAGTEQSIELALQRLNSEVQAVNGESWFGSYALSGSTLGAGGGGGGKDYSSGKGGGKDSKGYSSGGYSAAGGGYGSGGSFGSSKGGYGGEAGYNGKGGGYDNGYESRGGGGGGKGYDSRAAGYDSRGGGGGGYSSGGGGGPSSGRAVDLLVQTAQTLPSYVMNDERGFALNCIVPNDLVGALIGRGGSGTKEVQGRTDTKISIREINGDAVNRQLSIVGPLANICAAYMLMMQRYLDAERGASDGRR
eukprot:CAMPEP_0178405662 /NCGR_PEP_ID=MMETSP0689_2-20121128/18515_1 /TAXON_ID=160604 /ORGANISM="Amphidinium massartii, Strain CS-259" /LENGTH=419 /DNA_ID=CAMNT_0020026685 /DNA_START=32 /DNA_END=1292 /DNA_ORIENTATION=+